MIDNSLNLKEALLRYRYKFAKDFLKDFSKCWQGDFIRSEDLKTALVMSVEGFGEVI